MTMRKRVQVAVIGALLIGLFVWGLVVLDQGHWLPFIAGDRPVTEEQIRAQLAADGWSDVDVRSRGDFYDAVGKRNGQVVWMTVDSKTGRRRYDDDVTY